MLLLEAVIIIKIIIIIIIIIIIMIMIIIIMIIIVKINSKNSKYNCNYQVGVLLLEVFVDGEGVRPHTHA